jgi:DNA-binding FadR family transcriptional regulator
MITQSEVALLKLRELILSGAFPPGAHLMEVPLAEDMNISRTPVRAALGALAREGLLNYTAKSGFIVRGFTVKEIVDAVPFGAGSNRWPAHWRQARGLVRKVGIGCGATCSERQHSRASARWRPST